MRAPPNNVCEYHNNESDHQSLPTTYNIQQTDSTKQSNNLYQHQETVPQTRALSKTQHLNHDHFDQSLIPQWRTDAKFQLKTKIRDNLNRRVVTFTQAIKCAIKDLIQHTKTNRIWSTLYPNTPIYKYENTFPLFTISQTLIDSTLKELYNKVNNWRGVDITVMKEPPKHFKKYLSTADNWWQRNKSEWIGDHFFYELLQNELHAYIGTITHQFIDGSEKQSTQELIYFVALRKILYTECSFNRARPQPLIFDQTFTKSDCLQQFFAQLGSQHGIEWNIPHNRKVCL
eukprot:268237_1